MTEESSVWARLRRSLRPEPETYRTRPPRGSEPGQGFETQKYEATDHRRHGGTGAIGGH